MLEVQLDKEELVEMKYNNVVDKLLFDYYAIHCRRKGDIYSPFPFYLSQREYAKIKFFTEEINKLSLHILNNLNNEYGDYKEMLPNFPLKDEILNISRELPDIFWCRYDSFIEDNGRVFFSEGNYDKPCAQRELAIGEYFKCNNNVNKSFTEKFIVEFKTVVNKNYGNRKINVLILADSCHYEEVHLSMLYREWLQSDNINIILGGSNNLYVKNYNVYCFKEQIHIILRQFPTENLYELNDIDCILKAYEKNNVLIINDPRVIILQSKSIFAYFHKLLKEGRLPLHVEQIIEECIPYTELLSDKNIDIALKNKDKYVIKPMLGRYSEEVFIGKLYSENQWIEIINSIEEYKDTYILQEFRDIRIDNAVEIKSAYPNNVNAFCNFGVYLCNNKVSGICSRWNYNYLTDNESTFITPIGVLDSDFTIRYNEKIKSKAEEFKDVNLELVNFGFLGAYNNARQYISLDEFYLNHNKFEELVYATEEILKIFNKVSDFVYKNKGWFDSILDIESMDRTIYTQKDFHYLSILGRMDWVLDIDNNLKLLELNNETPAGLYEASVINDYLIERYKRKIENPNDKFYNILSKNIEEYIVKYLPKTIGIFSTCYYEDYYNIDIVFNIVSNIAHKYNIEVLKGNIYNLKVIGDNLYYFNKKIDMIYRYFPLNWFDRYNLKEVLEWINNKNCINQPVTMIAQSKALFAVIYEMMNTNFFTDKEKNIVIKYIPYTDLSYKSLKTVDYLCKPIFEREGKGIYRSGELSQRDRSAG